MVTAIIVALVSTLLKKVGYGKNTRKPNYGQVGTNVILYSRAMRTLSFTTKAKARRR